MHIPLSVCIITFNEEDNLEKDSKILQFETQVEEIKKS
jgi:hypothetical protein